MWSFFNVDVNFHMCSFLTLSIVLNLHCSTWSEASVYLSHKGHLLLTLQSHWLLTFIVFHWLFMSLTYFLFLFLFLLSNLAIAVQLMWWTFWVVMSMCLLGYCNRVGKGKLSIRVSQIIDVTTRPLLSKHIFCEGKIGALSWFAVFGFILLIKFLAAWSILTLFWLGMSGSSNAFFSSWWPYARYSWKRVFCRSTHYNSIAKSMPLFMTYFVDLIPLFQWVIFRFCYHCMLLLENLIWNMFYWTTQEK